MKNRFKFLLIILALSRVTSFNHLAAMQSNEITTPGIRVIEDSLDNIDQEPDNNSSDENTDDETYAHRHEKFELDEKSRIAEVLINTAQCTQCETWHTIPDFIDIRIIEKNDQWTCNDITWTDLKSPCTMQLPANHKQKGLPPIKNKSKRKNKSASSKKNFITCTNCERQHKISQHLIDSDLICLEALDFDTWTCKDAYWLKRIPKCKK